VLVIEDEAPIRRFLRATLDSQGYRLIEAATGADGLREARTRQPDVLLLDLGLPDLDGLEVIRRLREWTTVPIIVLSARGQEQDKVAALDAGADDYLSKPFGVGELLARVRVVQRHAARFSRDATDPIIRAGRAGGRSRVPDGAGTGPRDPAEPDRVSAARDARPSRRPGDDASAAVAGRVGAGLHGADGVPATLHEAPAAQA
jgi:CheY-like chemotaxis protein